VKSAAAVYVDASMWWCWWCSVQVLLVVMVLLALLLLSRLRSLDAFHRGRRRVHLRSTTCPAPQDGEAAESCI
jgi:hypothetical protein